MGSRRRSEGWVRGHRSLSVLYSGRSQHPPLERWTLLLDHPPLERWTLLLDHPPLERWTLLLDHPPLNVGPSYLIIPPLNVGPSYLIIPPLNVGPSYLMFPTPLTASTGTACFKKSEPASHPWLPGWRAATVSSPSFTSVQIPS